MILLIVWLLLLVTMVLWMNRWVENLRMLGMRGFARECRQRHGAPRHTSSDVFRISVIFLLWFLFVFVFAFIFIFVRECLQKDGAHRDKVMRWFRNWGFWINSSNPSYSIESTYKITGKCFCSHWPVVKYINRYDRKMNTEGMSVILKIYYLGLFYETLVVFVFVFMHAACFHLLPT